MIWGINMTFNNKDFINMLNFYKNQDNFPVNARKSFDNFSQVSKSDDKQDSYKEPLIIDDRCIFDLDNMCFNSYMKKSGHVKGNRPASVDGMHFINGRLYLVEFKGTYNATLDLEKIINECIKNVDDTDLVGLLETIKNRYDDEIISNLKIKPSDSLFFALPHIYKYYCENTSKKFNKEEFILWLLKVPKRLFVVFLNDAHSSERNESKSYKHLRMDTKLKKRYAPFKELLNMENLILTQDEFKKEFIEKFLN